MQFYLYNIRLLTSPLSLACSDLMYALMPMTVACVALANGRSIGTGIFSDIICNITGEL